MFFQKQFSGAKIDPKIYENQKSSQKKICVECFFQIKIERISFYEHMVRYQWTLMFPFFFPFLTAFLP